MNSHLKNNKEPRRIFNCHAHCFTYDYVPEFFLTTLLPVSALLRAKWLINSFKSSAYSGKIAWPIKLILNCISFMAGGLSKDLVLRYMTFVIYGYQKTQEDIIFEMQKYYPKSAGLVMLSMDMEYMGAGKPKAGLKKQLEELAGVKIKHPSQIYPFIHCDPEE